MLTCQRNEPHGKKLTCRHSAIGTALHDCEVLLSQWRTYWDYHAPFGLSCCSKGGGMWLAAAVTMIPSKGPASGHPK